MEKVTNEQQFREAVASEKPTVAVFKADWCPDCRFLDSFMSDVADQYKEQLNFIEVDRDQMPELCTRLDILGIPSFVSFLNGRELIRFVSKLRKTREEVERFLDRVVEVANALPK